MLEVSNLHARVGTREILKGINLSVKAGEVHAIMGPNGSGKSTLAGVLAGREDYEVTAGSVTYRDHDLLDMEPEDRAREGLFLAFQYPVEIPGVNNAYLLKAALNEVRKHRGDGELDALDFMAFVKERMALLDIDAQMLKRSVNEGFSGGEKKRNEIFQMAVLEPRLAVMDETDSGLDIDALKIVARGVNACAVPAARSCWSPTTSGCSTTSCRTSCMCSRAAASSGRAARSWRWSSKTRATAGSTARPPVSVHSVMPIADVAPLDALADAFEAVRRTAPSPGAIADLRRRAVERFSALGMPTTRQERWRFTNVAPIAGTAFTLAAPAEKAAAKVDAAPHALSGVGARLTFINGRYVAPASDLAGLPAGVEVGSLADALGVGIHRDTGRGERAPWIRGGHRRRAVHGAQHGAPP